MAPWAEARGRLKLWREKGLRRSREVLQAWKVVEPHHKSLGDEVWDLYEQVALATLDCDGHEDIYKHCYDRLALQFPGSTRVQVLQGMHLEAGGEFEQAKTLYSKILEEEPTSAGAQKRMVAVLVAQRDISGAIRALNDYLGTYAADQEAWQQLAELCLEARQYQQAAFCLEELVLASPLNYVYSEKYAEIMYTIGDSDSLKLARKYFAQALKLNPASTRALYGLYLAAEKTSNAGSSSQALAKEAGNQLRQRLEEGGASEDAQAMLEGMLKACSLSATSSKPAK